MHILLDLGGVVFESTGKSNPIINWQLITQLNQQYGHQLNLGQDFFGEFMRDYNHEMGLALSGEAFLKALFDTLHFNQDLVDGLRRLGHLHILSDNYRENIAYLSQRYAFESWAEQQFYSFAFETTKSDPTLFESVLAALPVPAQEVLFIDDDPENIRVAASVGIRGICYQNNEQVWQEIEGLQGSLR